MTQRQHLTLGVLAAVLIFLTGSVTCFGCPDPECATWTTTTNLSGIVTDISAPTNGQYVKSDTDVTCTIPSVTDTDTRTPCEGSATYPTDTCTYTWSCPVGTFPNGSTGTSVTWHSPNNPGTSATITCTVDDETTTVPEGELGSRDDASVQKSVTVNVVNAQWYPDTGITPGTITAPAAGTAWAVNSEVACSISSATDNDKRHDPAATPQDTYPADTFNKDDAYVWSATAGGFKNGQNKGQSVTWVAPSSPSAVNGITIKCTMKDDAEVPTGEQGSRDDTDVESEITVTAYEIGCVKIEATNDQDIYYADTSDGEGNTSNVIWKANQSTFESTGTIVETCTRKAVADAFSSSSYTLTFTLARHPSCTTSQTPTTELWGTPNSGWTPAYTVPTESSVTSISYNIGLAFKVSGIQTGTQSINGIQEYDIYGNYLCAQSDFTKEHLGHACSWGNGGTKVTKDDIPAKIQENSWLNFTWSTWVDPWSLGTTAGDCRVHSGLLEAALKVLGVAADGVSSSGDTTYKVGETRWCSTHSAYEWHYFQEIRSGPVTNFEAVCKVNLSDEATPYDCYFDKAMGATYQKGTHDDMWKEWNSDPPPNNKVIHHYTNWQNH